MHDTLDTLNESDIFAFTAIQSLEFTSFSAFWINPDGTIFHVNKAALERLGYTYEELMNLSISLIDRNQKIEKRSQYWEMLKRSKVSSFESALFSKDENSIPVEVTTHYIVFNEQEYEVLFATDISLRKKTEEALKESEEYFQALFEQAVNSILVCDPVTGKILQCNSYSFTSLGYSKKEFLESFPNTIEADYDETIFLKNMQTIVAKGTHIFEARHRTKTGDIRDIIVNARAFAVQGKHYAMAILQDITAIKLAQRDLERKEKRYQSLVESLNEGILAIDKEGKTTFVNEQMARMLGYSADELLGKSIYSYMLSNEATHAAEKLFASNTGEYKLNDFQFVKADASLLYVTIEPAPIYNEYGVCTGVMCGVVNITEKKEAELQLKAQAALLQQKNSALKEVLSQIEDEKTRIKQSVALNVEEIILPLISKMKIEGFSDEKMKILVNSLQQITSDFGLKISHKKNRLSPRETEICNLIKQGLSSKEISQLLHISPATTERYRNNIRAKLGIVKKNVNLVTYLNNL